MIDFIKLNITHLDLTKLLAIAAIKWRGEYDILTAQINDYPIKGELYNLKLKINRTRIEISGSLHIYWNLRRGLGDQNFNDFNYDDLVNAINDLISLFGKDLLKAKIENLEYGMNVKLWKKPEDFIRENIIVWDGRAPSKNLKFDGKGKYVQWNNSQVYQKCYDKGKHHRRPDNIFRWERKAIKGEYLKKYNIQFLVDLFDKVKLRALVGDLIASYDKLIIVNTLNPTASFTAKENQLWAKCINPIVWENLSEKHRSQKSRLIDKFTELLQRHGLDTFKEDLRERLISKWDQLLLCNDLTDFENYQNATNLPVYIESDRSNNKSRLCPVTGIDITHQKEESRFVWVNSLMILYENDRNRFYTLCKDYLKLNKSFTGVKEMCYYIAHNIRNKYWNMQYRIRKAIRKYEKSLFPYE